MVFGELKFRSEKCEIAKIDKMHSITSIVGHHFMRKKSIEAYLPQATFMALNRFQIVYVTFLLYIELIGKFQVKMSDQKYKMKD